MPWGVHGLLLLAGLAAAPSAFAAPACPGNPDALGTSRTLVVDPTAHPRIGTMQYDETLPLADKEVVLTFDDGPLPKYSDVILDILAAECIKATFFAVGIMAKEYPDGVRRLRDAGHTIGSHTQHHPIGMKRMGSEAAQAEIDGGIAAITAALGEAPAPFFRIPGLSRAETTEDYAGSKGLQVWSADFPADDWRHISTQRVHGLAMSRIEAKGKGVLLLHDIQPRTVAALPGILRDLKAGGYRIVHVVPSRKDLPATPTEPQQWRIHAPVVAAAATAGWPAVPGFAFARSEMLPIPDMPRSGLVDGALMLLPEPFDRVKRLARGTPLPIDTPWRAEPVTMTTAGSTKLPVPGASLFDMPDRTLLSTLPAARPGVDARPQIEASAARRAIPGSVPVTRPGLNR